jgi:N-carbamoyl-L-amino-acid hydrolase
MAKVADRRGVVFDLGAATRAAPALMPPEIQSSLASAAVQCGVDHISLPSGGGHDCATFAEMGIFTGMIFIRNQNGSHNPDEHMDFADFCCAADVLTKWVQNRLASLQT